MISLYNTAAGQIEDFHPHDPDRVMMYVCGPTVYDVPHLGNARPAVVFDVLFRLLRQEYGTDAVFYARNLTDIDDKIVARANERGISIDDLTQTTTAAYHGALDALQCFPPTAEPRATRAILAMEAMIGNLVTAGKAYEAAQHVYFDTQTYDGPRLVPALQPREGARIEQSEGKRHPADFVLWKPAKAGEPAWDSRWGPGRPGWHIECSAMIHNEFGAMADIHGGGIDLLFPHHEAELQQSYSVHGCSPARYWLHNGMVTINGRKMSKSEGNFVTIPEILKRFPGEVVRYFLLTGYYRQPLDFTWDRLAECERALDRLYSALRDSGGEKPPGYRSASKDSVYACLCDDLNTPEALASLHDLAHGVNTGDVSGGVLANAAAHLGLLEDGSAAWFSRGFTDVQKIEIEALIVERSGARSEKAWQRADELRARLRAIGVEIEDKPYGTVWKKALTAPSS